MADIAVAASAIVLSPLLQTFFERMVSSEFVHFLRGQKLDDGLLMRLKMKLESVIVVVEDAEGKQFTKPAVKMWLDRVKHVVYDAEDILDEIATKELRLKLEAELGTPSDDIWNMIPTFASQVIRNEIQTLHIFLHLLLNCCHYLPTGFVDCAGSNWVN